MDTLTTNYLRTYKGERLDLSDELSFDQIKALAANRTLRTLNLSRDLIGDKGARALAVNKALRKLELLASQIGDEGLML